VKQFTFIPHVYYLHVYNFVDEQNT